MMQPDAILSYGFLPTIEFNLGIDFHKLAQVLRKSGFPFIGIYATDTEYQALVSIFTLYECSIIHISAELQSAFLLQNVSLLRLPELTHTFDYNQQIIENIQNHIYELLGLQLIHIGINVIDDAQSHMVTDQFKELLHLPVKETPGSFFVGSLIEVMRQPFLGECGHIAIGTKNISLAYFFYKKLGYEFNEETIVTDENNHLVLIYFKNEIGNFAVHLKQL
ncbi:MAG: hypothetical protein ACYDEX_08845 [Mobilitalea sp.]